MVLANVPSFRFSFRGNIRRNHPFGNHPFVNTKKGHWEIKGRFPKGWFWRTYPRSGFLGPAFGRTDFSRIFIFEPPDFFADFLAGFFLLIFVGKSAQKNPPGKSPGKSSEIYTTKILRHISADWPGQGFRSGGTSAETTLLETTLF